MAEEKPLFRAMLAMSLDGYIADRAGGVAWLDEFNPSEFDFDAFMQSIGITVYGRATYDFAIRHTENADQFGRSVVLTHRPVENPPPGVESYAGDIRPLAERLRAELADTGKDVWLIGGSKSIAAFHEAGLVDRWELSIIPVLLHDGISLFETRSSAFESLRLTHSRTLSAGIVELWYEPAT